MVDLPRASSQDDGSTVVSTIWIFVALSILFVTARLFTRARIVQSLGLDDWLISLSLLLAIVFAALITASIAAGIGHHSSTLDSKSLSQALLLSTASFAPGILSFTIPKLAVVALLLRIFNPTVKVRVSLWAIIIISDAFILGCVIILYTQCDPPRALWDPQVADAKCISPSILTNYSIAAGTLSALVDLFLAIYPATVLWKLQMTRKRKIGLSITLGLGIGACAVAVYKCTRLPGLDNKTDFTYSTTEIFLWTSIEANTIIIAACVPAVAPLIDHLFGRHILGSTGRSAPSYSKDGSLTAPTINLVRSKKSSQHRNYPDGIGSQGEELWAITKHTRKYDDEDHLATPMHSNDLSNVSTGISRWHRERNGEDDHDHDQDHDRIAGEMGFDCESVGSNSLNHTKAEWMGSSDVGRDRGLFFPSTLPAARRKSADPTRSALQMPPSIWKRLSLSR